MAETKAKDETKPRAHPRAWGYVGAVSGGVVSVAANIAHSFVPPAGAAANWQPYAGAVLGAAVWPIMLFLAIEIMARTVWPAGGRYKLIRFGGLTLVAIVAAVVSYRHMAGLLQFYGEDQITCAFGPLAVDGLMVMALGALVAASQPAAPVDVVEMEAEQPAKLEAEQPADFFEDVPQPVRWYNSEPESATEPGPRYVQVEYDQVSESDPRSLKDQARERFANGEKNCAKLAKALVQETGQPLHTRTVQLWVKDLRAPAESMNGGRR